MENSGIQVQCRTLIPGDVPAPRLRSDRVHVFHQRGPLCRSASAGVARGKQLLDPQTRTLLLDCGPRWLPRLLDYVVRRAFRQAGVVITSPQPEICDTTRHIRTRTARHGYFHAMDRTRCKHHNIRTASLRSHVGLEIVSSLFLAPRSHRPRRLISTRQPEPTQRPALTPRPEHDAHAPRPSGRL